MPFTGRAIYDTGAFNGVAEDVADIVSMISPFETPLLDQLGDAPYPAKNVLHEWLEDELTPNTVVTSVAAASTTNATSLEVHVGGATCTRYLKAGAVLKVKLTGEYLQVTSVSGEYVSVTREFGDTTADTIIAGAELFVISDVGLEGEDVSNDRSRPRTRKTNYCQIYKKDVIVSGTMQAVTQLGGITNELDYQKQQRTREAIRDLEKAVIQGKISGNTLGSSSAYRTSKGIWDFISTNIYTCATVSESYLGNAMQAAWDNGATDLDLIVADVNYKRVIDGWNSSRVEVPASDSTYRNKITFYESTFGVQSVVLGRWMPANSLMILSTQRVKVMPLQGRSFKYESVAKTGDAEKGMIIGEYVIEVKNEDGLAKLYS